MLSSVPVHLDYYKSKKTDVGFKEKERQYIGGVSWLTTISLSILIIIMIVPYFQFGALFSAIVCFTFFIEKICDESSRALEFRKNFLGWFLVQIFRSSWVFFAILASIIGLNYQISYLMFSILSTLAALLIFVRVIGVVPFFNRIGLVAIKNNIAYLVGAFLPASYRQLPRIAIARIFPEQAHAFMALAQLSQGIGVLFNVRFQIPYRKIISRKTFLFQKLLEPAIGRLLIFPAVVFIAYFFCLGFVDISGLGTTRQMLFFAPIVSADALLFSIMSAHLGYIQWVAKTSFATIFYFLCAVFGVVVFALLLGIDYVDKINLAGIPAITLLIGFAWLFGLKVFFFGRNIPADSGRFK